jgi:hypothetical protein
MALRKNLMLSFLIPSLSRDEARTALVPFRNIGRSIAYLPPPQTR